MKIGVDIDGVLADFNTAFIERVVTVTGRDLFPPRPFDIPIWDYPQHYGYSEAETRAVWQDVITDRTFWLTLPPYHDAMTVLERLRLLSIDHEVYFVTSRPGIRAKQQSETWLATHSGDFTWNPTVLISGDKGACADALGLDCYIDDRWENCTDVVTATRPYHDPPSGPNNLPKTLCFVLDRPWNQSRTHPYIYRIEAVDEMLDQMRLVDRAA